MSNLPKLVEQLRAKQNAILQHCHNESNSFYKYFGARGIRVCKMWRKSVSNFVLWGLLTGYDGTQELTRIDPNRDFTSKNCRWLDHATVLVNRRGPFGKKKLPTNIFKDEHNNTNPFAVRFDRGGVRFEVGNQPTLEKAIIARDRAIKKYNKENKSCRGK